MTDRLKLSIMKQMDFDFVSGCLPCFQGLKIIYVFFGTVIVRFPGRISCIYKCKRT